MIQFNLVPDVKLEYIKTSRLKHTVTVFASIIAGAALLIMILLYLAVYVAQKSHITSLNSQINTDISQIKSTPNLNKVLTVQDAVNALPALDKAKPVPQRLPNYMSQVTPLGATISALSLNFTTNSLVVSGSANSLATINSFVDTLEDTYLQTSSSTPSTLAFSQVTLSNAGYTPSNTGQSGYSISMMFNPDLFSQAFPNVALTVPSLANTRANSSSTAPLFQQQTTESSNITPGSGTN